MKMQNAAFLAALMCAAHEARAQNTSTQPRVPVATRDLDRGAVLSTGDIRWADTTTDLADARLDSITPGWVVRRNFRAGEILREPGVSRPDLVSTGDAVDVIYSAPGLTLKVRGTAIGSGGKGDEVYVRLDNRKRLRGIVAGLNTVRVM